MNTIEITLKQATIAAIQDLYGVTVAETDVIINETRKEFEGDVTVVIFPFVRFAKKAPHIAGQEIGEYILEKIPFVECFNVIKGFVNFSIADSHWLQIFQNISQTPNYGTQAPNGKKVVLEYCGPNTNKALHLGHIRNMLTGYAMANILSANGYEVHKVNIYNDRGIAISKSMVAWQQFANEATPESEGMKGDHFVEKWYVKFSQEHKKEVAQLLANNEGMTQKEAEKQAPIQQAAEELLRKWEAGDKAVKTLWQTMNNWVYGGFEKTYAALGVDFEKAYKESETYLVGKEPVLKGLEKGIFYKKEDGSIWADLTAEKLDHKVLLRSDGTSLYITQDIGTADLRYGDYKMDKSIYVVGDEQDYHFKVLKVLLQKLGKPYADGIYHLSYGMVDLPTGKMKSREGTTVHADSLMEEVFDKAEATTKELGKTEGMTEAEANTLYKMIGLGALKYFMLKVNPQKRMLFNPEESIAINGHTGPFMQYSHARIQSILRKFKGNSEQTFKLESLEQLEKELIMMLYKYPQVVAEAAHFYDPSVIANFAFHLAKMFNSFYAELSILNNDNEQTNAFRVALSAEVAKTIKSAMKLLGIDVPDRM